MNPIWNIIHIVCQMSSILFVMQNTLCTFNNIMFRDTWFYCTTGWTNGEKCNECNNPEVGRTPAMDETHDCFLLCLICSQLFLLFRTLDIHCLLPEQKHCNLYSFLAHMQTTNTTHVFTIDAFTDE